MGGFASAIFSFQSQSGTRAGPNTLVQAQRATTTGSTLCQRIFRQALAGRTDVCKASQSERPPAKLVTGNGVHIFFFCVNYSVVALDHLSNPSLLLVLNCYGNSRKRQASTTPRFIAQSQVTKKGCCRFWKTEAFRQLSAQRLPQSLGCIYA